jgi:hypothetical protein
MGTAAMTDDLVAYLLDDLSPERRAEVEAKLESDVVWRWELERLRECMAASGDIQQCAESSPSSSPIAAENEPPVDLVKKTCCFVEDSASGKFKAEKRRCGAKAKPVLSGAACEGGGRRWSLADATIAAGVLLILAALVTPAIQQSRATARRFTCENNLRGWGLASEHYAQLNNGNLPTVLPGQPAAIYLTRLVDSGVVSEAEARELSACPDSPTAKSRFEGEVAFSIPTSDELTTATGAELYKLVTLMGITYAVPVGNFDQRGRHYPSRFTASAERPLAADAPAIGAMGISPVMHIGGTQNVLNEAGCVKPYVVGVLPAEDQRVRDLHLNDEGVPAAGTSPDDHFLALPMYGPDGPVVPGHPKSVRIRLQFVTPIGPTTDGQ